MIDFTPDGQAIVSFDIISTKGDGSRRSKVKIPLVDYIALSKACRTLEELRVACFNWEPVKRIKTVDMSGLKLAAGVATTGASV